jgi:peptidoglycan/LPS O-acetylase OafA/YrhL
MTSAPPAAPAHPRITPIDSLRGIAALCVANYHFGFVNGYRPGGGYLCVDLFFILSGVVLTHVYEHKTVQRHITFRHFFANRMARLYPLYLLTFLVMAVFTIGPVFLRHQLGPHLGFFAYTGVLNVLLLQNVGLTPQTMSWNLPSWSISTEIVINVLWFHLLLGLRQTTALFLAAIAVAAALLLFGHGGNYNLTCENVFGVINGGMLRCVAGFFLGCLLYRSLIGPDILQRAPAFLMNAASLSVLAVLAAAFFRHGPSPPFYLDSLIVLLLFPALVLCSLHHGTALSHVLRLRLFRYLGDISYSVYLLQWPVGSVLSHVGVHPPRFTGAVWVVIYFACLLIGSALSFHYVEMPLRNYWRSRP